MLLFGTARGRVGYSERTVLGLTLVSLTPVLVSRLRFLLTGAALQYAKVTRPRAFRIYPPTYGQSASYDLTERRCPAWHPVPETEIIDGCKLFWR